MNEQSIFYIMRRKEMAAHFFGNFSVSCTWHYHQATFEGNLIEEVRQR